MNNEDQLGKKIADQLNRNLNDIDPRIATKLQVARKAALEQPESSNNVVRSGKNTIAHYSFFWNKNTALMYLSMILMLLIWIGLAWKINHENGESTTANSYTKADDMENDIFPDDDYHE